MVEPEDFAASVHQYVQHFISAAAKRPQWSVQSVVVLYGVPAAQFVAMQSQCVMHSALGAPPSQGSGNVSIGVALSATAVSSGVVSVSTPVSVVVGVEELAHPKKRRMNAHRCIPRGIPQIVRIVVAALVALGCSTPAEPSIAPQVFGDDRVADALQRDPARAPRTIAEHEALFGIGRQCKRADSHEVFVIEERATRFAEVMIPTPMPVPRAIITGCNPNPESLDGVAVSFGLMTVVPTDPKRPTDDPLAPTPIEVMALDRTTGLYSFYVFDDDGVQQIVRDAAGVHTIIGRRDGTISTRMETTPRCFGCHVNGGPLMASLADPWTSWVSTRSENPAVYVGESASLVAESNQLKTLKRASFANALEGVMRNGIRAFVVDGLARSIDVRQKLRSVFCETELQFASTFDTVPLQIAVDPAAAVGSGLTRPIATDTFPQLLPIRSEIDLRIEESLVMSGVLTANTLRAIRLVDDENDIFSDRRCALLSRVLEKLPTVNIDAHVRSVVRSSLSDPYALALLEDREDGRDAYFAALWTRVEATFSDRALLERRLTDRQARARRMFPGRAHPLPIAIAQ